MLGGGGGKLTVGPGVDVKVQAPSPARPTHPPCTGSAPCSSIAGLARGEPSTAPPAVLVEEGGRGPAAEATGGAALPRLLLAPAEGESGEEEDDDMAVGLLGSRLDPRISLSARRRCRPVLDRSTGRRTVYARRRQQVTSDEAATHRAVGVLLTPVLRG